VNDADAEQDAQQALQRGDFRLLAMTPRQIIIPGVDSELVNHYELKCGIKVIEGISDTIRSKEQLKLIQRVHAYAKKYNEIIKVSCKP
jgi:hypothetical protein